jgi:hypothetical protein
MGVHPHASWHQEQRDGDRSAKHGADSTIVGATRWFDLSRPKILLYEGIMKRTSTTAAVMAAFTLACGAPQKPTGAQSDDGNDEPVGPDGAIDVGEPALQGLTFQPEGLGRPGMPLREAKRKVSLAKQREMLKKAEPDEKEILSQVLATQLYEASKVETGDKETALLEEARTALRSAVDAAAGKAEVDTLKMLGVYEVMFADWPAAAAVYGEVMARFPGDADAVVSRTYLAWALLQQRRNGEAKAALAGVEPSESNPELAYVIAWTRWRTGDGPGAWQAIRLAASSWGSANRSAIERDYMLMAGRTGAPVAASSKLAGDFVKGKVEEQYTALYKLHQAYAFAGRYSEGIALLDQLLALKGAATPKDDVMKLRFLQAEYSLRLDAPDRVNAFASQSLAAMSECATGCDVADKAQLVSNIGGVARAFHRIYGTSLSTRYLAPARELLTKVSGQDTDAAKKIEAEKLVQDLDAIQKKVTANPELKDKGTHDVAATLWLIGLHNHEVLACYEQALLGQPSLAGDISLTVEFDQTGAARGATTEPAGGQEGLAAASTCVESRARSWRLPDRQKVGKTVVKVKYKFSPKG